MADETKKTVNEAPLASVVSTDTDLLLQLNEEARETIRLQGEHIDLATTEIEQLTARLVEIEKDVAFKNGRIENLERKLKAAKSAPTGDVVFLDGKSWAVKGTVQAKFATDEVKKGHIQEDVTLVVIDRRE